MTPDGNDPGRVISAVIDLEVVAVLSALLLKYDPLWSEALSVSVKFNVLLP